MRCTLWAIRRLSTMRPGSPILLLLQRSGFGLRAVRPLRAWIRAAVVACRRQCSARARGPGFAPCAPATRSLMSTAQVDAASVYVRCRLPLVFASLLPMTTIAQLESTVCAYIMSRPFRYAYLRFCCSMVVCNYLFSLQVVAIEVSASQLES